jgi:hypothetical protein
VQRQAGPKPGQIAPEMVQNVEKFATTLMQKT